MGPSGRFIKPLGDLDFEEAYDNYYQQAQALESAGADYILIETFIDIQEMRAALLAAKDATNLPDTLGLNQKLSLLTGIVYQLLLKVLCLLQACISSSFHWIHRQNRCIVYWHLFHFHNYLLRNSC